MIIDLEKVDEHGRVMVDFTSRPQRCIWCGSSNAFITHRWFSADAVPHPGFVIIRCYTCDTVDEVEHEVKHDENLSPK